MTCSNSIDSKQSLAFEDFLHSAEASAKSFDFGMHWRGHCTCLPPREEVCEGKLCRKLGLRAQIIMCFLLMHRLRLRQAPTSQVHFRWMQLPRPQPRHCRPAAATSPTAVSELQLFARNLKNHCVVINHRHIHIAPSRRGFRQFVDDLN